MDRLVGCQAWLLLIERYNKHKTKLAQSVGNSKIMILKLTKNASLYLERNQGYTGCNKKHANLLTTYTRAQEKLFCPMNLCPEMNPLRDTGPDRKKNWGRFGP